MVSLTDGIALEESVAIDEVAGNYSEVEMLSL